MPPPELPGFFWDAEKNKYFKIQPNHKLPIGAAYSADSVKRRKQEDAFNEESALQSSLKKGLIRRATRDPLLGGGLSREHGLESLRYPTTATKAYVQGWREARLIGEKYGASKGMSYGIPQMKSIRYFDWDPVTGCLFLGGDCGQMIVRAQTVPDISSCEPQFSNGFSYLSRFSRGDITALEFDPTSRFLLVCDRAPFDGSNVSITRLTGDSSVAVRDVQSVETLLAKSRTIQWTIQNGNGPYAEPITISTATHAPASSPNAFALGTSNGVYTIDKECRSVALRKNPRQPVRDRPSDIVSVEFMSHNPNFLLAGKRHGHIDLMDLRNSEPSCESGHSGISHAAGIARVKQLNENTIVVSGLNNTLCEYDMRFCINKSRAEVLEWSKLTRCTSLQGDLHSITQPTFVFHGHENKEYMDAGFAVDRDSGLVAATQTGRTSTVKIFSSRTGETLKTLEPPHLEPWTYRSRPLRFVSDRGNANMKSLWVGYRDELSSYAW